MADMIRVRVNYGKESRTVDVDDGSLLGDAVIETGLSLEQPCAGRGTCGKCKVLVDGSLTPPDEIEIQQLSPAELAAGYRLACRARVQGTHRKAEKAKEVSVTLAPILVYSNKIFQDCDDYKRKDEPLGLAIDLGSTTVAAFLTLLNSGKVCAGAAALNQQTVFGADVISRLAAADSNPFHADRLAALGLASIVQAIDALKLSHRIKARIKKVTIVGNCAMHHLLLKFPVDSLAVIPFQPYKSESIRKANDHLQSVLPKDVEVTFPPLIGGFVGSDALACLVYFGFDRAKVPMAAIDLGTNGEVMVTDGERILVASTAAGPAFEGVNISCGSRAVDGAGIGVEVNTPKGSLDFITIGGLPLVGLTGSGLLSLVNGLREAGVIEPSGRMVRDHSIYGDRIDQDEDGVRRFALTLPDDDGETLYLTQHDIRELQKAKGAVRAAVEVLMARLNLTANDLERIYLTGSFGSQVDLSAVMGLGMIPRSGSAVIETPPNGAGLGAAMMLDENEFNRGNAIAKKSEQVDLDLDANFIQLYIDSLVLSD